MKTKELENIKFKDLLQIWEDSAFDYYSNMSNTEIEKLYVDWFGNPIEQYSEMGTGQMIDELIEDEYNYRKQDSSFELKNAIIKLIKQNDK